MSYRQGFSLVELSIVTAIIALITGGVLTGRSLITASEQRSIVRDLKSYDQAFSTFKDQYNYPPGDLPTATNYWGIAAGATGNDATCRAAESFTSATCNGDGSGWVGGALSTTTTTRNISSTTNWEWPLVWTHLAAAGLVQGRFSNIPYATNSSMRPGYNAPGSDAGAGGFTILRTSNYAGDTLIYAMPETAHLLAYGAETASGFTRTPVLTSEQAYNIDKKIDNGHPGTGKLVVACTGGVASCTTSVDVFAVRTKDVNTALIYKMGQ